MDIKQLFNYLMKHYPDLLAAVVIMGIGFLCAQLFKRFAHRYINTHGSPTEKRFLSNFIYVVILLLALIIALTKLGVPTASLITVLGAAGLALSLAFKDFLANVIAGFTIIFMKPFKIGDTVETAGRKGKVVNINVFSTQLVSDNGQKIFIPNSKVVSDAIVNG